MSEKTMDLDQISKRIITQTKEELNRGLNAVYDSLVVNHERRSLPEFLFREHFLESFKTGNFTQDVMYSWINIAGGPNLEVDILDNETRKVLFTVPSILSTKTINTAGKNQNTALSMIAVISRYNELKNAGNIGATNRFLYPAFDEASKRYSSAIDMEEPMKKFKVIFDYYELGVLPNSDQKYGSADDVESYFEY